MTKSLNPRQTIIREMDQKFRPCIVTVFIFYFRFLIFKGKRKKNNFFFLFPLKTRKRK